MTHTLIAWMRDKPGVLNRVAGMLRRRNFNIDSLQVGHSETPGISRMTSLVRVATTAENRSEIMQLVDIYHGEIVDVTLDSLIVQIVGGEDRVDSLIDLLSHFGIQEMVRTGRVAMSRGQREGLYRRSTAVWRAQANGKDVQGLERLRSGGV